MPRTFKELKRNRARDFEKLRALMRLGLGTHKRTRLKKAGCHDTKTLLNNDIAAEHGKMLAAELQEA